MTREVSHKYKALTNEEKLEICKLRISGSSIQEIAEAMGVSRQCIYGVFNSFSGRENVSCKIVIYSEIKEWMLNTGCGINELCEIIGFEDKKMMKRILEGQKRMSDELIERLLENHIISSRKKIILEKARTIPKKITLSQKVQYPYIEEYLFDNNITISDLARIIQCDRDGLYAFLCIISPKTNTAINKEIRNKLLEFFDESSEIVFAKKHLRRKSSMGKN